VMIAHEVVVDRGSWNPWEKEFERISAMSHHEVVLELRRILAEKQSWVTDRDRLESEVADLRWKLDRAIDEETCFRQDRAREEEKFSLEKNELQMRIDGLEDELVLASQALQAVQEEQKRDHEEALDCCAMLRQNDMWGEAALKKSYAGADVSPVIWLVDVVTSVLYAAERDVARLDRRIEQLSEQEKSLRTAEERELMWRERWQEEHNSRLAALREKAVAERQLAGLSCGAGAVWEAEQAELECRLRSQNDMIQELQSENTRLKQCSGVGRTNHKGYEAEVQKALRSLESNERFGSLVTECKGSKPCTTARVLGDVVMAALDKMHVGLVSAKHELDLCRRGLLRSHVESVPTLKAAHRSLVNDTFKRAGQGVAGVGCVPVSG